MPDNRPPNENRVDDLIKAASASLGRARANSGTEISSAHKVTPDNPRHLNPSIGDAGDPNANNKEPILSPLWDQGLHDAMRIPITIFIFLLLALGWPIFLGATGGSVWTAIAWAFGLAIFAVSTGFGRPSDSLIKSGAIAAIFAQVACLAAYYAAHWILG
jgi:hypothetical protein